MADHYEIVCDLSIGAMFNAVEQPTNKILRSRLADTWRGINGTRQTYTMDNYRVQ